MSEKRSKLVFKKIIYSKMISELSDEEILNFLINSEFEGDFSAKELKYLLIKWKYFYRVLYGNLERIKDTKDNEIRNLNSEVEILKKNLTITQIERLEKENAVNSLKSRKLTWKERLTGKININEDKK